MKRLCERVIKYWLKLLEMHNARYPKKCYNMLLQAVNLGKVNWASKVKHLLYHIGFGEIWEAQFVSCKDAFMSEFVMRLKCSFEQNWHSTLSLNSKTDMYCLFKPYFGVEKYLQVITICKFKRALSRFRCSSHNKK